MKWNTEPFPNVKAGPWTFWYAPYERYRNGGLIIHADFNGRGGLRLSVCLPDAPVPNDTHFWAKTWSENEEAARAALDSGAFTDTGLRHATGFVEAQLWTINL